MSNIIVCPHCHLSTLTKMSKEMWLCAHCAFDFSNNELINNWGYDAADFFAPQEISIDWINSSLELAEYNPEPIWKTIQERDDAYEMVQRMLLNIPEIDEFMDTRNSLPYTIGNVGVS